MRYTLTGKNQMVHWRLAWRVRVRTVICILLGWPFFIEGDFTITGEGEVK